MVGASAMTLSLLSTLSVPKTQSLKSELCHTKLKASFRSIPGRISLSISPKQGKISSTRLYAAGLSEIEPDLNEDPVDRWRTNGVDPVCLSQIFDQWVCVSGSGKEAILSFIFCVYYGL